MDDNKKKYAYWMKPSMVAEIEASLDLANVKSKGEFVCQAVDFYLGYHDKSHHPHMHLVVYSKDPSQGWLTKKGIDELHSFFGNDIFRFEQQKLFRMETELRNKLKDETGFELLKRVAEAEKTYQPTPESVVLFRKLSSRLKNLSGKKLYAYLPKDVKEIVDQLVSDLAKSKGIAQLYPAVSLPQAYPTPHPMRQKKKGHVRWAHAEKPESQTISCLSRQPAGTFPPSSYTSRWLPPG